MEVEFQHVQKWSATNKLQINMTKTKELVFRQLGLSARYFTSPQPLPFIEQVKVTKLVEVYITVTFSAVTHIKHILSVANQRMYLLAQLKSQGLSRDALHVIFTAIVLLLVTYALPSCAGQLSKETKPALIVYFGKLLGVDLVVRLLVLTSSYH